MRKLALVLVIVSAAACKKREEPQPKPPPAQKQPAPEANMSGTMPRKMANCPSAVPGARTRIANSADGVAVTVTATDPEAAAKIAELANRHATPRFATGAAPHSGARTGNARIGFCPT